jgi:phage baseplate assembly protein W
MSISSRVKAYSDVDLKFRVIPNSGDIALKRDVEAVKQSVINILLTSRGEKVFQPEFGGNLRDYLFENFDSITKAAIEERIRSTLVNFEPRVEVISINTIDEMERNTLRIQLSLRIISPEEIITTVEFIVERLR